MPSSKNELRPWLGPLLLFFGGFFLLLALQEGCYKKAVKLSAVVVAKEYSPGTSRTGSGMVSSSSRHSIRYRFTTPEGNIKESTSDVLLQAWGKLKLGDAVDVEYLPATKDSRIAKQTASAPVFFVMALFFLALGWFLRRSAGLLLLACVLFASPLYAEDACDPKAPPDCSCGKLPVCIFSGHPEGFFSDLYARSEDPAAWKGFGEDGSGFGEALQVESNMAAAIEAAYPCLDVITTDSYMARIMLATAEGDDAHLPERVRAARQAGDAAALEQVKKEVDALFEKWGVGDMPWQNPDLASIQVGGRIAGCLSTVKLSGHAANGNYELSATSAVPVADALPETAVTASSATPEGGMNKLAQQVAGSLGEAHRKLFGSCQETVMHSITTDFELSHQRHRNDYTQSCNGQFVRKWSEDGDGIGMGRTSKREKVCCSVLARTRAGETGEPEDKQLMDQIWCPGTWNLWSRDLDCDGVPNAKDDAPWPPEHSQ